ncbi:MAG: DUF1697 domain-containing protein [Thermoanaerobaculia bacterium]|nr:DUF1697 domain-containing protein [Thermoanaerobaculia bacterium]MCZ7652035.1 DUF1697 domain-containing protein [Thermoanaerobaculia bacterium]
MPRYVAFLRGVMPTNLKMADLRRAAEEAGGTAVRTLLASGNVVFDAPSRSEAAVTRALEAAIAARSGRAFRAFVRRQADLGTLVAADPFASLPLPAAAKRIVTFLASPPDPPPALPVEHEGVRVFALSGREVLTAYLPHPRGPVFMTLLERLFGTEATTRTWDTVRKCAAG